jgi:tripartite-type tricarboxylate transporter receptor subunit TctC
VLKASDVSSRVAALGFDIAGLTPQATAQYISREMKMWASVIKDAAIRAE